MSASDPRVFKCRKCDFTYKQTNSIRFSEIVHSCKASGLQEPLIEQPKEVVA